MEKASKLENSLPLAERLAALLTDGEKLKPQLAKDLLNEILSAK